MSQELAEELEVPADVQPIMRSAFTFAESRNNVFSAVVPRGTTQQRLVQSGLWSVVADQLRSFDRILCIAEDRSYYAELLILDAGKGHCSVQLLSYHTLPVLLVSEAGLPPGFSIDYSGPVHNGSGGYQVLRHADGVIMSTGHSNREEALAALLDSATLK
ncbi:hypothetical protein ACN1C3_30175 [Pseudomonas sp. H11T01]|uniref:hypothetical protein n=1 Tax=Pseudomonas sp. H11T01 TaxID=3402749 RepID=UPI003ACECBD6